MQRSGIDAIGCRCVSFSTALIFQRIVNGVFGENGNITPSGADSLVFVCPSRGSRIYKGAGVHSPFTPAPRFLRSEFAETS